MSVFETELGTVVHEEDVSVSGEPGGLAEIFDPGCRIAVWRRAPPAGVDDYLAALTGRLGALACRQTVTVSDGAAAFTFLPVASGREAFAAELAVLAELFGDLLGCERVGLRLEVLDKAMCPRFHVDRTSIRLVCTYRGPGTEWLCEHAADRSRLGGAAAGLPDACSGLIRDQAGIGSAGRCDVVLLKGSLWQGEVGPGAIHRSPALPPGQGPRVLLAMDAVW